MISAKSHIRMLRTIKVQLHFNNVINKHSLQFNCSYYSSVSDVRFAAYTPYAHVSVYKHWNECE